MASCLMLFTAAAIALFIGVAESKLHVPTAPCSDFEDRIGMIFRKEKVFLFTPIYGDKEIFSNARVKKANNPPALEGRTCSTTTEKNCGGFGGGKIVRWQACLYDTKAKGYLDGDECVEYRCCSGETDFFAQNYGFSYGWRHWKRAKRACKK